MIIKSIRGNKPKIGKDCFIAENATITGEVCIGNQCSIWYNAVIRGDVNRITIGNQTNIQDGVVIHATYQKHATQIGNGVSIGHNAVVHGCCIEDNVLIGMGSIVMDGCVVGRDSIIASGAVVTEGTRVPSGSIYAGVPARKVKDISKEQIERMKKTAQNYIKYASWIED